jgi:hypothetical protein
MHVIDRTCWALSRAPPVHGLLSPNIRRNPALVLKV